MAIGGTFPKFFTPFTFVGGISVGTAVGQGVSSTISPLVRDIENERWAEFPSMPILAVEAAQLVASGERSLAWGKGEALNMGVNGDRFEALVDLIDTAPDLGTLLTLRRRDLISPADFAEGAKRQTIEDKWLGPLAALEQVLLSPAELANARQQGFIQEPEQKGQAALQGVNGDRAEVQFLLAGNPPGPMDALGMLRRDIIDEATYAQIIAEGRTKTKYTDAFLGLKEHVLNGRDVAGLWLRGWVNEAEAKKLGALDGWGPEEMERLYQNRGRPATTRQVHIGYARGATLAGAANEEEAIRTAVKQSNIRTEYADLLYAQRHTYPSAFVIRALAQDGTFSPELTETILVESGWKPEWAKLAAEKWGGGNGAGPSTKWADRARSRLFTVAHNEYLDGSLDEATARSVLAQIGASAAEQDVIIALWNAEQQISRLELSPSQIKKAHKKGLYTEALALAELEERGMTPEDADTFLQS